VEELGELLGLPLGLLGGEALERFWIKYDVTFLFFSLLECE
jgi:hypothetical protein